MRATGLLERWRLGAEEADTVEVTRESDGDFAPDEFEVTRESDGDVLAAELGCR